MKKVFPIVSMFVYFLSFGQEVEISRSTIFKDQKKRTFLSYALEDSQGGLVTIRKYYSSIMDSDPRGYYIQYFDSNLKLIKELDYKAKNTVIKNAFVKQGQLHLIEIENSKSENTLNVLVNTSKLGTLDFSRRQLLSFSKDKIKKFLQVTIFDGLNQMDKDHMGEVVMSKNNNYFLVNFDVKNKEKETHQIFVFNSNFEKIYENVITRNKKDRLFDYNDILVDDEDGTVFFLGKSFENNSRKLKKDGNINYHFELIKVSKSNGIQEITFDSSQKFVPSMDLMNYKNSIKAIGFFKKKKNGGYHGVCVFDFDVNTLVLKGQKFSNFSEKFITNEDKSKKKKKKKSKGTGIHNIVFKNISMMADGEIVINAEKSFTTSSSMSGMGSSAVTTHYHDIITIRLKEDGSLKWNRNINKRQRGPVSTSYSSITVGDTSYFFFNATEKVEKKKSGKTIFIMKGAFKKADLYMASVNGKGDIKYKKLIDHENKEVFFEVNRGIANLNKKTVVFSGKRMKKTRIVKINL